VASALAGGVMAGLATPRVTYFLTIPFAVVAIATLLRFREPKLHRTHQTELLRGQVATTYRTILERGRLRPIIVAGVLCALLLQMLVEFGPVWMVALAAPAFLYGPQWAGLMSAMGLGGVLAGRLSLTRRTNVVAMMVVTMLACSLTLTSMHNTVIVIAAQVVLALLLVAISTQLTQQLHDAIPSSIRAGVSSGVGTLTWIIFVPTALGFGLLSRHTGVLGAGWMFAVLAAGAGLSLAFIRRAQAASEAVPEHSLNAFASH
jgi:hypothetical protein